MTVGGAVSVDREDHRDKVAGAEWRLGSLGKGQSCCCVVVIVVKEDDESGEKLELRLQTCLFPFFLVGEF